MPLRDLNRGKAWQDNKILLLAYLPGQDADCRGQNLLQRSPAHRHRRPLTSSEPKADCSIGEPAIRNCKSRAPKVRDLSVELKRTESRREEESGKELHANISR